MPVRMRESEGGAVMATARITPPETRPTADGRSPAADTAGLAGAAHQAFWLLRAGFTVAPILFGVDKFFNWSVHWPDYLAGWINDIIPGSGQDWKYVVGGIEIAAGL